MIKTLLKTALLSLSLTTLTVPAWSQPAKRPMGARPSNNGAMDRAAKEIGLTPQQKVRAKKIVDTMQAQARAIQTNSSLKPEQKQAKMIQALKTMDASLQAILTPAQRKKVAELRQQRMKEIQARMKSASGARPAPGARR